MGMNELIRGALLSISLLLPACKGADRADPSGSADALARPGEEPSVLGVWSLQTVQTEGQLRDGSPPFRDIVRVRPGANSTRYTTDHKAVHLVYANAFTERSYRAFGDSLIVSDSATVFRERILDLTSTRLVTVTVTDKPEGLFKVTTTSKRTSLEELEALQLEFLNNPNPQ